MGWLIAWSPTLLLLLITTFNVQKITTELSSRIVRTQYGELTGVIIALGRNLESIEVFRGVPYASPPTGNLRFMPPVSSARWHGVRVADKFSPVCPQRLPNLTEKMPKGRLDYLKRLLPYLKNQSEDCLYLNIYAPIQGMCILHFFVEKLRCRLIFFRSNVYYVRIWFSCLIMWKQIKKVIFMDGKAILSCTVRFMKVEYI